MPQFLEYNFQKENVFKNEKVQQDYLGAYFLYRTNFITISVQIINKLASI